MFVGGRKLNVLMAGLLCGPIYAIGCLSKVKASQRWFVASRKLMTEPSFNYS
jgi:hypothetical protein